MLDCKLGGFVRNRHDQIAKLFGEFLKEAGCYDVHSGEIPLLPVQDELNGDKGANKSEGARLDVTARNFWPGQRAFFDVRVFDPFAPSYRSKSVEAAKKIHKNAKKREYGKRVRDVEKACFTPLVFTTAGGCAKECDAVLKRLSSMIAEKKKESQSIVMNWMRTQLSFSLIKSCVLCLRGTRDPRERRRLGFCEQQESDDQETDFEIAAAETRTFV
jgi:hypothetical protein